MKQWPQATCWFRSDCNRLFVRRVAEDGLSKDEWAFGFGLGGACFLRALFHFERAAPRRHWNPVTARCWFSNADASERAQFLADDAVPLPSDIFGPLVANVVIRWEEPKQ